MKLKRNNAWRRFQKAHQDKGKLKGLQLCNPYNVIDVQLQGIQASEAFYHNERITYKKALALSVEMNDELVIKLNGQLPKLCWRRV